MLIVVKYCSSRSGFVQPGCTNDHLIRPSSPSLTTMGQGIGLPDRRPNVVRSKDGCVSCLFRFVHHGSTNGALPLRCFSDPIDENMLISILFSPYVRLSYNRLLRWSRLSFLPCHSPFANLTQGFENAQVQHSFPTDVPTQQRSFPSVQACLDICGPEVRERLLDDSVAHGPVPISPRFFH